MTDILISIYDSLFPKCPSQPLTRQPVIHIAQIKLKSSHLPPLFLPLLLISSVRCHSEQFRQIYSTHKRERYKLNISSSSSFSVSYSPNALFTQMSPQPPISCNQNHPKTRSCSLHPEKPENPATVQRPKSLSPRGSDDGDKKDHKHWWPQNKNNPEERSTGFTNKGQHAVHQIK